MLIISSYADSSDQFVRVKRQRPDGAAGEAVAPDHANRADNVDPNAAVRVQAPPPIDQREQQQQQQRVGQEQQVPARPPPNLIQPGMFFCYQ